MSGGDSKTTQQDQQSVTNPYGPAQPLLQNILTALGGMGTGETGAQSGAIGMLGNEIGSIGDNTTGENAAVSNALATNTGPQQQLLTDAYNREKTSLAPITDPNNLNPFMTPGFSTAMDTLTNNITNQVKSTFAGSGRDPSGAGTFGKSEALGLEQGEAPIIAQQYNSNVGNLENASNLLQGGATSTAGGLTAAQLAQITGQGQGLTEAGALPGILEAPGSAALNLANTSYGLPYSNISTLENLVNPIASLGGSTSGSGTTVQSTSTSPISTALGGITGLAGLNGAMGSGWLSSLGSSLGAGLGSLGSSFASALPLLAFSDENLKENIEQVGETYDGQPLYSYNYIGDDEPRVGLLAQDVEQRDPGSVHEIAGFKAVNYPRALRNARKIGMLELEDDDLSPYHVMVGRDPDGSVWMGH